jgi:serine/threonine protein kinase
MKASYFSEKENKHIQQKLKTEEKLEPQSIEDLQDCDELGVIGIGNSLVVKACSRAHKKIFAVKKVSLSTSCSTDTFNDIKSEAKIMSRMHHKNIVTYYDTIIQNGFLKIFMEFIDGGSIESLIQSYGRLDTKVVANFTRQICKGLKYLHEHNIMHRDIKCANILVSRHGEVKLTDFGCAKEILNVTHSFKGTPGFMAPEVR